MLNTMLSCPIYIATDDKISLIISTGIYGICALPPFSSSTDRNTDCVHVLATLMSAALNTGVQVPPEKYPLTSISVSGVAVI